MGDLSLTDKNAYISVFFSVNIDVLTKIMLHKYNIKIFLRKIDMLHVLE